MSVSIMTPSGPVEVPTRGGGYKLRDIGQAASDGGKHCGITAGT